MWPSPQERDYPVLLTVSYTGFLGVSGLGGKGRGQNVSASCKSKTTRSIRHQSKHFGYLWWTYDVIKESFHIFGGHLGFFMTSEKGSI